MLCFTRKALLAGLLVLPALAWATPEQINGRYECGNGQAFTVQSSPDMTQVRIRYNFRILDLERTRVASGAAWGDGEWLWHSKGPDSLLEHDDHMIATACHKVRD